MAVPRCRVTRSGRKVSDRGSIFQCSRCGIITELPRLLTGKSSVTPWRIDRSITDRGSSEGFIHYLKELVLER